jgi:ribonuclease Z
MLRSNSRMTLLFETLPFAMLLLATTAVVPATVLAQALTVTLLGTGTPVPRADRFGPSILVQAGSQLLLFDCGRGAPIRLAQIHVPIGMLTAVFITHLHSDHVSGFPDLWLTGWLASPRFGNRTRPMHVYGPQGTAAMMTALHTAYAADLRIRAADELLPAAGAGIVTREIEEGVVYDSGGVKVTAFVVDHGDVIKPAFGYRIDHAGHSVVLSGDTRPTENLIRFARGTDLLVHEVIMGQAADTVMAAARRRVLAHHTSPQDAGRIFGRVRPKLAVFSHVALQSFDPDVAPPTPSDLLAATRTTYTGPLEVGEDLMRLEVGESVTVHRFTGSGYATPPHGDDRQSRAGPGRIITMADAGQALRNSAVARTSSGTSSRAISRKPKLGK